MLDTGPSVHRDGWSQPLDLPDPVPPALQQPAPDPGLFDIPRTMPLRTCTQKDLWFRRVRIV
jgi:hypothetical protein